VFFGVMLCMTRQRGLLPVSQLFGSAIRHAKKEGGPT